jgi:peroxiredoxin Q/BCP
VAELEVGATAPAFTLGDQHGKRRQRKFDEKHGLGFSLLADEDHKVASKWGAWGEKSMYGKKFQGILRSAFVVDERGKIAGAFYKVSPKATVERVTEALADLDGR